MFDKLNQSILASTRHRLGQTNLSQFCWKRRFPSDPLLRGSNWRRWKRLSHLWRPEDHRAHSHFSRGHCSSTQGIVWPQNWVMLMTVMYRRAQVNLNRNFYQNLILVASHDVKVFLSPRLFESLCCDLIRKTCWRKKFLKNNSTQNVFELGLFVFEAINDRYIIFVLVYNLLQGWIIFQIMASNKNGQSNGPLSNGANADLNMVPVFSITPQVASGSNFMFNTAQDRQAFPSQPPLSDFLGQVRSCLHQNLVIIFNGIELV